VIYSREDKELAQPDRDLINGLRREFDHRLVALIEEGVASGEFQVDDIRMAALAIGGIIGWSQVWFRPNGRLSIAQASESVGDLVLAMGAGDVNSLWDRLGHGQPAADPGTATSATALAA
jgi:hypothetical protein